MNSRTARRFASTAIISASAAASPIQRPGRLRIPARGISNSRSGEEGAHIPIDARSNGTRLKRRIMRTHDLRVVMPPACPGDSYVPSYPRDTTIISLVRVSGGGEAAAGNADKTEGVAGLCVATNVSIPRTSRGHLLSISYHETRGRWGRLLSPHANTSQPLGAGGGNAAPHLAQVSRSRGTECPHAGHFSRTGQRRWKR